jgi:hypothetical protein
VKGLLDLGMNCQSLRATGARAETTTAGIAKTGAWFAAAADVYATEVGLFYTGPAGARIGI